VNGSNILGAGNISFGLVLDYGRGIMRTRDRGTPKGRGRQLHERRVQADHVRHWRPRARPKLLPRHVRLQLRHRQQGHRRRQHPGQLDDRDEAYGIGPNGGLYSSAQLDAQKLSFLALHGKLRLTRVDRGIGLAVLLQAGVPLTSAPRDLGADPKAWY